MIDTPSETVELGRVYNRNSAGEAVRRPHDAIDAFTLICGHPQRTRRVQRQLRS